MCLILFAVDSHPQFSLVVAANRDEFYARPTRALQPWSEAPHLLAGKDLEAGGTWFGLTRSGRFAAVTNARDAKPAPPQARSRGALPLDFLLSATPPALYAQQIANAGPQYAGFNLLVGDRSGLHYCANGDAPPRRLAPGIYGIANAGLDTPWPKVESGKAALRAALQRGPEPIELLKILADAPASATLPTDTPAGIALEHIYKNSFIRSVTYGTRASTVLLLDRRGVATVWEQSFGSDGELGALSQYRWPLDPLSI